jgi:hypothetical protein
MGNVCESIENPAPVNYCNSINDSLEEDVPGFCTYAGVAGDKYRNNICQQVGAPGEWGNAFSGSSCNYNDCNPYQRMDSGCCKGCCGIIGRGGQCRRIGFTGDPLTCCMNNVGNQTGPGCWSDSGQKNTCADGSGGTPNYRQINSNDCQQVLLQYCSGTLPTDDYSDDAWLQRWTTNFGNSNNNCLTALQANLFPNGAPAPPPAGICNVAFPPDLVSPTGLQWTTELINSVFIHYQDLGYVIGATPATAGFNEFQNFLYDEICCPYPSLCQSGLKSACSRYTLQRISNNAEITRWCGCHLVAGEYAPYADRFNIPPQCSSSCNRSATIPLTDGLTNPILCKQDVCIIDDITVNLINTQVGGNISIDQFCGNCGSGGNCSCIISDSTLDILSSSIGGNVTAVNQNCTSTTCTRANPSGIGPAFYEVPCSTTDNPLSIYQQSILAAEQAEYRKKIWFTVAILIFLIAIAAILFFFLRRTKKSDKAPEK